MSSDSIKDFITSSIKFHNKNNTHDYSKPIGCATKCYKEEKQTDEEWYSIKEKCIFCEKEFARGEMNYHIEPLSSKQLLVIPFKPNTPTHPNYIYSKQCVCFKCTKEAESYIEK
jgi:hypothetical protein